jgi:hypothetical protein
MKTILDCIPKTALDQWDRDHYSIWGPVSVDDPCEIIVNLWNKNGTMIGVRINFDTGASAWVYDASIIGHLGRKS